MNDNTENDLLCRATEHYEDGFYHSAAISFKSWRRNKGMKDLTSLQSLAVAADHALCRFRACTNPNYREHVLYQEAIIKNSSYLLAIRQLEKTHSVVEAGLLTSVSAVWIHTKMNNIKMARHKIWDILEWATPSNLTRTLHEKVELLSKWLPAKSQALAKFQHALNILQLLESKDLLQMEKEVETNNARLNDQKEALKMIVRRKLEKNVGLPASSEVALKVYTVMKATDEVQRADGTEHNIILEDQLAKVVDKSNPSDLNLLGCLQIRRDCSLNVLETTFAKALELLRHTRDTRLLKEISFNISKCLLQLGDYKRAKELLMWLQSQEEDQSFPPQAIPIDVTDAISKGEVLWSTFAASTLDNDLVATLIVVDKWRNEPTAQKNYTSISTTLAIVFALAQANRASLIKETIQESSFPSHLALLLGLTHIVPVNPDTIHLCTNKGLTVSCLYNNLGLAELGKGNDQGALALFEEACSSANSSTSSYFHPYYNLTLLLLKKNDISQAFKCWNQVRHVECDEHQSIQQVTQRLDAAVQDYTSCKRPYQLYQQGGSNVSLSLLLKSTSQAWTTMGIGGLPSTCALLIDCLMLQHRLNELRHEALENLVVALENTTHNCHSHDDDDEVSVVHISNSYSI